MYNDLIIKEILEKHRIKFVDLKAVDLQGRLHHISLPYYDGIFNKLSEEGVGFDGSSYGFQKVENSDMILIPDFDTASIDPFREEPTMSLFTNIVLTDDNRSHFSQDGRFLAKKTEQLLEKYTDADLSMWGPEFEFYIFNSVKYKTDTESSFYQIENEESFVKNGYHAANPFDMFDNFRDKASLILLENGVKVKYHHHEVGEKGQQEIETYFDSLLKTADNIILTKYLLFNLAKQNNLSVTFMPKPMYKQAGNGMHLHMFLQKFGKNAFHKSGEYGNINDLGKYFIGGILKHAASLSAFTNPSTNSYKRLVPGFEAPVALTYGRGNRASAIRIPKYISNPDETRFEYRPPDATCNPYFCLSAILLAGIDGVVNKIDPQIEGFGPFDKKQIDENEAKDIQFLPRSLSEALDALLTDNEYLKRDGIFSEELINQWIAVKREEVKTISTMPHPFEYNLYFSL